MDNLWILYGYSKDGGTVSSTPWIMSTVCKLEHEDRGLCSDYVNSLLLKGLCCDYVNSLRTGK